MRYLLFEAVSAWAPVTWGRGNELPGYCPFLVWRQDSLAAEDQQRIAEIASGYRGRLKWNIYKGRRNWVLQPQAAAEFKAAGSWNSDVDAMDEFSRLYPDLVEQAALDLPGLAAEIARHAPDRKKDPKEKDPEGEGSGPRDLRREDPDQGTLVE